MEAGILLYARTKGTALSGNLLPALPGAIMPPAAAAKGIDGLRAELRHALDPVSFAREVLGVNPDPWPGVVLRSTAQQLILVCSRQSGKSATLGDRVDHKEFVRGDKLDAVLAGFDWSAHAATLCRQRPRSAQRQQSQRGRLPKDADHDALPTSSAGWELRENPRLRQIALASLTVIPAPFALRHFRVA